jgi:hypothetical protein
MLLVFSKLKPNFTFCLVGIGTEAKSLGFHVQLGPVGGPLGKIAEAGWDVQLRRLVSWRS